VTVREGKPEDYPTFTRFTEAMIEELWQRPFDPLPIEDEWYEDKLLFLAEADGEPVGSAVGALRKNKTAHLHTAYVVPERRHQGVGKALLRAFAERLEREGVEHVTLDVDTTNPQGIAVWSHLGFVEFSRALSTPLEGLKRHLAEEHDAGPSFASIHVQTDDRQAVEQAVRKYVPRLGHSAGSEVSQPRNGWAAVYDHLCDAEPKALRRLALELSNAIGTVVFAIALEQGTVVRFLLIDRGRIVDEYLSVPEFYGPLPPGDVVALAANPTVISRLTGADPEEVRAVALTAASADELPPAPELLRQIAEVIGLEGADHGYGGHG
jgi:ribosomal protein S18 acetylase RimI-like enzyme